MEPLEQNRARPHNIAAPVGKQTGFEHVALAAQRGENRRPVLARIAAAPAVAELAKNQRFVGG